MVEIVTSRGGGAELVIVGRSKPDLYGSACWLTVQVGFRGGL
jgi:hypothetical protein